MIQVSYLRLVLHPHIHMALGIHGKHFVDNLIDWYRIIILTVQLLLYTAVWVWSEQRVQGGP